MSNGRLTSATELAQIAGNLRAQAERLDAARLQLPESLEYEPEG